MGPEPEELKADIAERRRMMGEDLEAIGDRVSPGQIIRRRRAALGDRMAGWRQTVMGAPRRTQSSGRSSATSSEATGKIAEAASRVSDRATGLGDQLSSHASDLGEQLAQAPDALRTQAQGNPLAAGLITFGAGLLVASVLPASQPEQQAAQSAQPQLLEAATQAHDIGDQLSETAKSSAREAAESLKSTASEAAQAVKTQASDAGTDLKSHATEAAEQLKKGSDGPAPSTRPGRRARKTGGRAPKSPSPATLSTASRNERHVTPRGDGWQVVAPGSKRASLITDTQQKAVDRAHHLLERSGGGEVVIHDKNGKIRDSYTVESAT